MADMFWFVTSMGVENNQPVINGEARCSPSSESITWSAAVDWNDTPAAVNSACQSAAIAAAAAADPSYTVGALDNKIALAGADALL